MLISAASVVLTLLVATFQQSDTTVAVSPGSRLDVQTMGGSIAVSTWNRNEVRVQARHGSRDRIRVETSGSVVRVENDGFSFSNIVDYDITVPVAMDLDLSGIETDMTVRGINARVNATTVGGDIEVEGGSGQISLNSVSGDVVLRNAGGSIRARAVSGRMRLESVSGDIDAQTVSSSLTLENVNSSNVIASSVSGRLYFDGPIQTGGRYSLSTHSGQMTVSVPENLNATISVALISGRLTSSIGLLSGGSERGRRQTFTAGNGSATVELESFSGSVRVVRRGEATPPAARESERGRDGEFVAVQVRP